MLRWTRLPENSSQAIATTITACLVGKKQSSPATVLHQAYRYSVNTLKKTSLGIWKVVYTTNTGTIGPGQVTEEKIHHRGRINVTHVDHFVEFINRLYFSQDVTYGTKFLNLNSGETIEIPNAVRTVKRSAMISQYIQFCQEEKFEPPSRTTLFKILEAGQASQRKSFQGLDNTAADGSAGFQKIEIVVDDLEKGGLEWIGNNALRLKKGLIVENAT